jgi:hypothetical protein
MHSMFSGIRNQWSKLCRVFDFNTIMPGVQFSIDLHSVQYSESVLAEWDLKMSDLQYRWVHYLCQYYNMRDLRYGERLLFRE